MKPVSSTVFGLACLLLALTSGARAASSVDLSVAGKITPSACTPTLGEGAVIDYGKIPAKDLSADSSTWLPEITLQLRVSCAAATLFALRGNDNHAGTAHLDEEYSYGMGLINGNEKVGRYMLTLRNPMSDTAPVTTMTSTDNGQFWWSFPHGVFLVWHQLAAFGDTSSGVAAPIALVNVTADLHVAASIAPANGLTLDEEVRLDGSATLDVFYL
ncbi:DUF1120 domain-containing protein [Pseudomonas sp. Marseille-Q1929]|uniref:DUF1120 domain-containing protein n=1 Tax=Pseudomonas sp. Marseille-Q1929 TaxID=2730402 RepID=UPI001A9084E1|nr:DUF1120 domain-containing protein [Pseudomonas sp. Marseille-Q1929]MBO0491812.1 DUF1120 domain-containing protein [Pseudomonas sp. Marseille-Q1929]